MNYSLESFAFGKGQHYIKNAIYTHFKHSDCVRSVNQRETRGDTITGIYEVQSVHLYVSYHDYLSILLYSATSSTT